MGERTLKLQTVKIGNMNGFLLAHFVGHSCSYAAAQIEMLSVLAREALRVMFSTDELR